MFKYFSPASPPFYFKKHLGKSSDSLPSLVALKPWEGLGIEGNTNGDKSELLYVYDSLFNIVYNLIISNMFQRAVKTYIMLFR